jgi:hypothetical protein
MDNNTENLTNADLNLPTEQSQANDLAKLILSDITAVSDDLVAAQYKYNTNLNAIEERLRDFDINVAYILTLLKATRIIVNNIAVAPDITEEERATNYIGSVISIGLILKDKLDGLPLKEATELVAIVSNLLSILEINIDVDDTTTEAQVATE